MNIYLVERIGKIGYDEFVSAVVSASNTVEAVEVAKSLSDRLINSPEAWENSQVTELGTYNGGEAKVLHSEFNAA